MPFEPPDTDGLDFPRAKKRISVDTASGVDAFNHLFHVGGPIQASTITVEGIGEASSVQLEDAVGETSTIMIDTPILELARTIDNRSYFWPDLGDRLWDSNLRSKRRVMSIRSGTQQYLADIESHHQKGKAPERIIISNITWGSAFSLEHRYEITDSNRELLQEVVQADTGIIVANLLETWQICGASMVLALRPDALFVSALEALGSPSELLEAASKRLVVLGSEGQDPVELLTKTMGVFTASGSGARAAGMIVGSVVQTRVPRVCSGCARSAPVDPATINFLPQSLRPPREKPYMIGRGCDACKQSGFRGTVGIDSIVRTKTRLKDMLAAGSPIDQVTEIAYRSGTRSMMEDAVYKAAEGLTTLDAIVKSVKRVSAAFEASIVAGLSEGESGTLKDQQIDTSLAALGDDFFTSDSGRSSGASGSFKTMLADRKQKVILVVEDDEDQQSILRIVLEKEGYKVEFANNGVEGLEAASKFRPDLIISDLMMPKMNGNEFVAKLRENPQLSGTPVLVLTVIDNADAEHKLLSTGADDYCAKTVRKDVLLKRIERLLLR
ncbi:MAG: response regulator [Bdellovibrionales bacterium]|nr:response regulator [Bdellovibrionales bacterium]